MAHAKTRRSEGASSLAAWGIGLAAFGWGGWAMADPTVTITSPTTGIYGDTLPIAASVTSTYSLRTVHAQVESAGIDLAAVATGNWSATLDITSVAQGSRTLIVTAEDVYGTMGTATATITVDKLPKLSILAPIDGRVVRPLIPVDFSCTDDDPAGCTSVKVVVGGNVLATGQSSLSTSVAPPASAEGASFVVDLVGTDSAGQSVTQSRTLYLENGPGLTEILRVPGSVFDFTAAHVLYLNQGKDTLLLRDRSTSADTVVVDGLTANLAAAAIYKDTVVYQKMFENNGRFTLSHWKGGGNTSLIGSGYLIRANFPNDSTELTTFALAGPYVLFVSPTTEAGPPRRPTRHNLDTGTSLLLDQDTEYSPLQPPHYNNFWSDVAANGNVVYSNDLSNLAFFYRESTGKTERIVHLADSGATIFNEPLTNGTSILHYYIRGSGYSIGVSETDGTLTEIAPWDDRRPALPGALKHGKDYRYGGDWIGYTHAEGPNLPVQAWTRSPAGVVTNCSTLNESVSLAGLSPDGEIVFDSTTKRYRSSPTTLPPQWVGGAQGKVVYKEGGFYVLLGDTLFRMGSPPPGDGGTGAPDATPDVSVDSTTPPIDTDAGANDGGAHDASADATPPANDASVDSPPPGGDAPVVIDASAEPPKGNDAMPDAQSAVDASIDRRADGASDGSATTEPPPSDDDAGCTIGRTRPKTTAAPALLVMAALAWCSRRSRRRGNPLERRVG